MNSWKDLYRQAIESHRPMQDLLHLGLQAAEGSSSETLKAQVKTFKPMPAFELCRELDRWGVPAPAELRAPSPQRMRSERE